jgi:hypothetical protein
LLGAFTAIAAGAVTSPGSTLIAVIFIAVVVIAALVAIINWVFSTPLAFLALCLVLSACSMWNRRRKLRE